MQNSLKPIDLINEIRLLLISPQDKNKIFILVEGDNDARLFRKLFKGKFYCIIKSVPGGVENLIYVLKTLMDESKQIIGIRDADFLHLKKKSRLPILFLTDNHDLEMMLIMSDKTLNSFNCEFLNQEQNLDKFRTNLFKSIKLIGYLRFYNYINNLELDFKGLSLIKYFNENDIENLITILIKRSPNTKITDVKKIINEINKLRKLNYDLTQICCGHDATQFISFFISERRSKGISSENVESFLRIAYTIEEFQKTNLFIQIQKWSIKNNYNII